MAGLIGCDTDDKSCEFMGQTYPFDSVFQAGDGCNICHCGDDDGRPWVECTLVACLPDAGSVIDAAVPDASMTDAPPDGPSNS
ncbi:MAG TPA: hypothetical protein VFG83_17930 [Kofleriaceae bacterium]|nr:hypothetical protein [Kofleriaceae bacterium]